MKKKSLLLLSTVFGIAVIFATTGIYAGTEVQDEIKMKNSAYKKHTKGIVLFTHKKHTEEYAKENPDLYKNKCGECHHDDENKPLCKLKEGDDVQNCIECHKKPGMTPKKVKEEWTAKKLSAKEKDKLKLEWHSEALHKNCKGCHRKFWKKAKKKGEILDKKRAPKSCKTCHPTTKK